MQGPIEPAHWASPNSGLAALLAAPQREATETAVPAEFQTTGAPSCQGRPWTGRRPSRVGSHRAASPRVGCSCSPSPSRQHPLACLSHSARQRHCVPRQSELPGGSRTLWGGAKGLWDLDWGGGVGPLTSWGPREPPPPPGRMAKAVPRDWKCPRPTGWPTGQGFSGSWHPPEVGGSKGETLEGWARAEAGPLPRLPSAPGSRPRNSPPSQPGHTCPPTTSTGSVAFLKGRIHF